MASSVINEDGTVTNTSVLQDTTPQVAVDSVCGKAAAAQVEAAIATTPIEG